MAAGGTRSTAKRFAIASTLVLIAVTAVSNRPAQARSDATPPPLVGGHYERLQAGRVVDVRQLAPPTARSNVQVPNHAVMRHAKSYAPSTARRPLNAQPLVSQGTVEEQLTVFPGIDVVAGAAALGNGQKTEPPDTQIAVGPDKVLEMVNNNMTTWSKSGARLSITDLNSFYPTTFGFNVTDPRVLFDAPSGRFMATAFALDAALDSIVYLAVSQTSDPGGLWSEWVIKATTKTITDQPKVGVSDDKLAISWAEGVAPPCGGQTVNICFTGEVTYVVQKSDVLAVPRVPQPHTFVWGPDQTRFGILPVHSLSPTATQYLVYNDADPYWAVENQCGTPPTNTLYWNCPTLGIVAITGTPAAGNVALAEANPAVNASVAPPDAQQLGGSSTTSLISTGDDRLVSAIFQNNRIWTSATEGNYCSTANPTTTPAGSCLLVLEAATDFPGFPMQQMWVLGGSNDYAFYPAIALDNAGDALVGFSRSNSTMYAGAFVTGQSGFNNPWTAWAAIAVGTGIYDSQTACGGHNRWGDYSGAAPDPTDPTDVWVAGEYAKSGTPACNWATSIARLTYSQPTVTSVTARTGSAGTSVVITGTDFLSGNTIVYFGANPASVVTVQTPNQLTATAPSGSGLVSLSAATPDGHGPYGAQFKYPRIETGAPLTLPPAGGLVRGSAPPRVPPSTAGPRPLVPSNSSLWMSIQMAFLRFLGFVFSP